MNLLSIFANSSHWATSSDRTLREHEKWTYLLGWTCIFAVPQSARSASIPTPFRLFFTVEADDITHSAQREPFVVPLSRLDSDGLCLCPSPDCCYWSLQHVYCLYTTEEAHLVMPSLPVSICAHQRELASKIKTESKTLLYDSILSFVPNRLPLRGRAVSDCIKTKDYLLSGNSWLNRAVFES